MMWLIKLSDNWADEMHVEGFAVMSTKDFALFAQTVEDVCKKIDSGHTFTWYIGTNEWIEYYTGEEFKNSFDCTVIEDTQAMVLRSLLLEEETRYGLFPCIEDLMNFLADELEDELGDW